MGQIFRRKLIKISQSLLVTLPPGWVRFHRLTSGDVVLVESNGKLTIKPAKEAPQGKGR